MTPGEMSANFVLQLFRAAKLAVETQHVSPASTPLFTMTALPRAFLVRIPDRLASLVRTQSRATLVRTRIGLSPGSVPCAAF